MGVEQTYAMGDRRTMNSLRVLLVDGGSEKSDAISITLASANHTVLPTLGLDEAGEALFVEQFDAVLLASSFPASSLADFTAKLRGVEQSQRTATRIPVLALESVSASGGEAVCDGYVHEPIDPVALTEAVRSLAAALGKPLELKVSSGIDDLPILEPEKFEEQVGYDNELMVEIIDLFLEERKGQISGMEDCFANRDWESLSKIAHTIKGSLGSLHASRARSRAQELESASRNNEADASIRAYHLLLRDLEALEPELLELKDAVTSAS
jgi:HPt (histidine-containing phosphotransfer) domain-containing protein/CheY-like chemotaxis protein